MPANKPPVPAETFAQELGSVSASADRLRLAGLDHAKRVQNGQSGASIRRLLLERARRPENEVGIAVLERQIANEQRATGAFDRAVSRAEVDQIVPSKEAAVLHGFVYEADGSTQEGRTVAAVRANGAVRRFTCTDSKGYFRIDIEAEDAVETTVFLQVSDEEQVVLFRGDEVISADPGSVNFRIITLSGERLDPCPLPPDRATMPRLLDLPESEALSVLERFGITLARRQTQTAPNRIGLVISQEPPAGAPVTASTQSMLVIGIADAGNTVAVPVVVGLSRDAANATLEQNGLTTGRITQRVSDAPSGTVVTQSPRAGLTVDRGTAVDLVIAVARPDNRVEVPGVSNLSLDEAVNVLNEVGLRRGRVTFRDDERVGIVLNQAPEMGVRVPRETPVNLVVGRRSTPERVTVPDLGGQTLRAANQILANANLSVGQISGPRQGRVVRQRPEANLQVAAGSAVNVVLGQTDTPADPNGGQTRFVDELVVVMARAPEFSNLGVSRDRIRDILQEAGVSDPGGAMEIVALGNAEIRDRFGLQNMNIARTLRRLLREATDTVR